MTQGFKLNSLLKIDDLIIIYNLSPNVRHLMFYIIFDFDNY